jgi:peroxin-4
MIGARSLVGYWCGEERFDGVLEEVGERDAKR